MKPISFIFFNIALDSVIMKVQKVISFWYNQRSGKYVKIGAYHTSDKPEFKP